MKTFRWMLKCVLIVVITLLALGMRETETAFAAPPMPGSPNVYWVNDPGDLPDANGSGICDVGTGVLPGTLRPPCTLRAAIELANKDLGPSVIAFEICFEDALGFSPGGMMLPSGEVIITPGAATVGNPLPALVDPLTYINGYTQGWPSPTPNYDDPALPGSCNAQRIAIPNTNSFGLPMTTQLAVSIDGSQCVPPIPAVGNTTPVPGGLVPSGSILPWAPAPNGACSGFTVNSDRNVIAGLNILSWQNAGILIMKGYIAEENPLPPPSFNVVWGNFIGTDLQGLTTESPSGNDTGNRFGVEIIGGAMFTYVGDTWDIRNWGAPEGWFEEETVAERNLISGNDNPLAIYGSMCLPAMPGPFFDDGAGVFLGVDPCIRANNSGIPDESPHLTAGAIETHVRNNYIGVDISAELPLANSNGVWLNYDAERNHIGGCVKFPFLLGPHPACDPQHDVDLEQDANLISGNQRLEAPFQVGGHGIWLNGAPDRELLALGVEDVDYNEIAGNFVGVNGAGMAPLPNHGDGVFLVKGVIPIPAIFGAPDHNEIGATTEYVDGMLEMGAYSYGNLISGNGDPSDVSAFYGSPYDNGVELVGFGVDDNRIGYGNIIGLDSSGVASIGNGDNGVLLGFEVLRNYVHNNSGPGISKSFVPADPPSDAGAISGNGVFDTSLGQHGVKIESAAYNAVFRNCIGSDIVECDITTLGNIESGVFITGPLATDNSVGLNPTAAMTTAAVNEENWIHHNGLLGVGFGDGVTVLGDNSDQNTIRFNRIYSNADLGIDLAQDGVDTAWGVGPNDKLKWPDPISNAATWNINFTACSGCWVDFYATYLDESDAPSNGEGRYWLTSVQASGGVDTVDISSAIASAFGGTPAKDVCVTLTSTDATGNTSEFSNCDQNSDFNPNVITLATAGSARTMGLLVWGGLVPLALLAAWHLSRRKR